MSLLASDHSRKVCYNAAISACERGSCWQGAIALLTKDMARADTISFGALISACAKGRSPSNGQSPSEHARESEYVCWLASVYFFPKECGTYYGALTLTVKKMFQVPAA